MWGQVSLLRGITIWRRCLINNSRVTNGWNNLEYSTISRGGVVQMLKVQSAGREDRRRAPLISINRVITSFNPYRGYNSTYNWYGPTSYQHTTILHIYSMTLSSKSWPKNTTIVMVYIPCMVQGPSKTILGVRSSKNIHTNRQTKWIYNP